MKDLDFLPARYREKNAQRKTRAWRGVVLAMFSALLAAGSLGQLEFRRLIEAHLETVRQQYGQVANTGKELAALEGELRAARAEAELLTYLRRPWPRTQLLAAIAAPLPESITLRKLAVRQEEANASLAPPSVGQTAQDRAAAAAAQPAAERTLKRLRAMFDEAPLTVTLEGISRDGAAMHVYLGKLAESEWFSAVELRSVERSDEEPQATFRFVARLVVRPSYGRLQPSPLKTRLAAASAGQNVARPPAP
ncbi:MAG TPA: PilN domain-containing protein [Pirellulales bacterium]|jgi:hypothetical protein|nr:PilN domain-containing protein [Pirellulales bacterium]